VNPYLSILRTNRDFRLLYIGQAISQLGDWFNSVAVFALLLDLTGSATAVAWIMIVQSASCTALAASAPAWVPSRYGGFSARSRARSGARSDLPISW